MLGQEKTCFRVQCTFISAVIRDDGLAHENDIPQRHILPSRNIWLVEIHRLGLPEGR